jgi:hypothetical protein
MKTRVRFTGVLFALCTFLVGALPAHSAVLVGTQGSTFFSLTEYGVFDTFQPIADVVVGESNKFIGGFGVYGRAETADKIRWVIFDNDVLLWQSGSSPVTPNSGATWYDVDYPTMLEAGHTYTLGVQANNLFAWGWNPESAEGFGPIGGDGLVIQPHTVAMLTLVDGNPGNDFVADSSAVLMRGWEASGDQVSVRVFDVAGVPAIPEPAEWSMLLAGLLVMGFVANRRRRLSV